MGNVPTFDPLLHPPRVVVAPGVYERLAPELDGLAQLDRYQLLDCIARGSMGVVVRAIDRRLGRVVALKVVRRSRDDGQRRGRCPDVARARLRVEARAMAGLSHPNVVPLYGIEAAGQNLVIAMEFVRGQTLAQWLSVPHGWRETLAVLCAAGEGLAAAHASGVVHRDVKPDNVLLGEDGRVRVTDFGLAMLLEAPEPPTHDEATDAVDGDLAHSLTATGMSVGTPAYMALEQHTGDLVDARTDQFGFCAMLYEALFGVRPFIATSVLGLGRAKRRMRLMPPLRGGDVPKAVREAIIRGLAPSPNDRHASMAALLDALRAGAAPRTRKLHALAVAAAFLLSLSGTLALAQAAAELPASVARGAVVPGAIAVRVPGVLTEVARLADRGDAAGAVDVLADQYFAALAERRFGDAARAADLIARVRAQGDDREARRWQRHAEAARVRFRSDR